MNAEISADICILGAGSAGLSIAAGAAQFGRKVVLIEAGEMGGDCLNYGCVPSKALIAAAARAHEVNTKLRLGVRSNGGEIDFNAVMGHVASAIAAIAPNDSQERFEKLGVKVIRARGEFVGPRIVKAGDKTVSAKHFVIATGSSPSAPPIPGLSDTPYLTNETIFALREIPSRLLIIGGGPIGVEMAQAFRRLGANVELFEAISILGRDDPKAVDVVRRSLIEDGVVLHENCQIERIAKNSSCVSVFLKDGAAIEGSHLLTATGRRSNFDGLGLAKAGVETQNGRLKLDRRLRTTNKRVYAAGDAAGGLQFTHVAGDHASTIVKNILFKWPTNRRDHLAPRVTYTDPELASIGLVGSDAKDKYPGARTVEWTFEDNDRAQTEGNISGFIEANITKNGRILGATLVGAHAGEQIGMWSFAIANKLTIKAFTNYIAAYPTRNEISKRAGGAYYTPTLFSPRTKKLISLLSVFD